MRPRLIHPVPVTIERVDQAATTYDTLFNEPADGAETTYKPAEDIKAQVKFTTVERKDMAPGGETPVTSGYLLYRKGTITSLTKGDRIKSVDGIDLHHVYVISVEPAAAGRGGYHLEKALFTERRQG